MAARNKQKKQQQEELAVLDLGISCLISSATPKAEELAFDYDPEDTPVPVGWINITVSRVLQNPEYVRLFQARESMISSSIEQTFAQALAGGKVLTDDEKNGAIGLLRTNFEAQYKYALDTTPKYITMSEETWVAPPENSKGLQKEWNDLADALDIEMATTAGDVKDGEK